MTFLTVSRSSSPTLTPVEETVPPAFAIIIDTFFSWDDLSRRLQSYVSDVKDLVDEMDADSAKPYLDFCIEIETWLNDPASANLDITDSLKMWKNKLDEINMSERISEILLPQIIVLDFRIKK